MFPVHHVELEDVRRAHVGGPLNAALQKNQPVHAADAAHHGLHLSAHGKDLNVRLHILRLVAAGFRPLVGPVQSGPAHGVLPVRKSAEHQKVPDHPEHLARRRVCHGFEVLRHARHAAFQKRGAEKHVHRVAVLGKGPHAGRRFALVLERPAAPLQRVQPLERGRKRGVGPVHVAPGKGRLRRRRQRVETQRRTARQRPVSPCRRNHVPGLRSLPPVQKRGVRLPRAEVDASAFYRHSTAPLHTVSAAPGCACQFQPLYPAARPSAVSAAPAAVPTTRTRQAAAC